jgi:hypothetical protein
MIQPHQGLPASQDRLLVGVQAPPALPDLQRDHVLQRGASADLRLAGGGAITAKQMEDQSVPKHGAEAAELPGLLSEAGRQAEAGWTRRLPDRVAWLQFSDLRIRDIGSERGRFTPQLLQWSTTNRLKNAPAG